MNYKKLEEDKNELITRAESILKNAKEAEKELTEEEIKEVKELHERAQKIKEEINLREENEKMLNELKEDKETNLEVRAEEKSKETLEREEFSDFIRGKVGLNKRATLTNMTFTDNSAVVPKTIVNEIIRKVYDISPILERSTRYNVSGTLELPYYPALNGGNYDNITVGYQSEFSEITSTSGKFSTIELKGFLAGALTKISLSLINNAQFDIVNFVVNEMAYQITRFIEKELIHGTENKVLGLSTLSNALTAASASAISADEVIKLKDMVKDEYQNAGIFIMSPATRTALRLLKDQRGMYLLNDDISTPFGTNLLGKPVFVSDNMDNIAASKTTIFYGDMSGLATNFSEQINIQVLREHYTTDEVAYKTALVEDLELQGIKYLDENCKPKITYTLRADLENITDIGDTIEVIHEPLSINLTAAVVAFDYDCVLKKYTEITFGNFQKTLSNLLNDVNNQTNEIVTEQTNQLMNSFSDELAASTDEIWDILDSYNIIYEGDKLFILDKLPKRASQNVILFDENGLSVSYNGIYGTFLKIFDIKGSINFSPLKKVLWGVVTLGKANNHQGSIKLFNGANELLAEFTKDGIEFYGVLNYYAVSNREHFFAAYDSEGNTLIEIKNDKITAKKGEFKELNVDEKLRFLTNSSGAGIYLS